MRIYYSSPKRLDNLANLFHGKLKLSSKSKAREAVSIASGYHNHNEALEVIKAERQRSPSDCDLSAGEVDERRQNFVEKMAAYLGIAAGRVYEAYDDIRPFSGNTLKLQVSLDQIEWLASNITKLATKIDSVSKRPHYDEDTVYEGFMAEVGDDLFTLSVSEEGDICVGSDEPIGLLFWRCGLNQSSKKGKHPVQPHQAVLGALRRLDRKALFALRWAERFTDESYRFARSIPYGSHLLRALDQYPRLCDHVAYKAGQHNGEKLDVHDVAPLETFAREVVKLSRRKWPDLDAPLSRALEVAKRYLSVDPASDGCIPLVPAFLLHLPDAIHPTNTQQFKSCESFLWRHKSLFMLHDVGVRIESFAEDFENHYRGDWGRAEREPRLSYTIHPTNMAAIVIAQAAREAGYENASSGDFEEPEDEAISDRLWTLGRSLLDERRLGYLEVHNIMKQYEGLINDSTERFYARVAELEPGESLAEDVAGDLSYYNFIAAAVLHERHRGRTATEIVSDFRIDVGSVVADASDYGSEAYAAPRMAATYSEMPTSISAHEATQVVTHRLYLTAVWHDPRSNKSGNTTIAVDLPRRLDDIIPPKRYRYSRALGGFRRASCDRIYTSEWVTYDWEPKMPLVKAVSELQFMCATGLVPSKAHNSLGREGGEFPDADHQTQWIEPESGRVFFAIEPYGAIMAKLHGQQWADRNNASFVIPTW